MAVFLINPSDHSFGTAVITPRWLYVLAAATPLSFGDPVIVKGKGFDIKRSELDWVLTGAKASAAAAGQNLPPDFEITILNQLITIQVLLQTATDTDRAAGRQEASMQLTNISKRFASPEAFEHQLQAVGMTEDELLNKATKEATATTALRRELNVTVSDTDAKEYYDTHSAEFEEPEKVHLRNILLLTIDPATRQPLAMDEQQAKRKQINDLLKRIRAGEDFTSLTQYSDDPSSKDKGGELPPVARDQMSPELAAAAFSLTNDQTSDVIETSYGYYIIKLIDKTPAKKYGFNDDLPHTTMLPPENIKTVADACKNELEGEKIKALAPAYVEKLKKEYDVEIIDPTLKSLATMLEADSTNAPAVTPDK